MVIGHKRVNFFDNFEDGEFRYEDHPLENERSDARVGEFGNGEGRWQCRVIYSENEISSYDDVVWIFARPNFNLSGRFMKFEEGAPGRVDEFSYLIVEKLNFESSIIIFKTFSKFPSRENCI